MVALETSHGRFEAETLKEAQKAAKKAEREARKAEAERENKRQIAKLRADSNAYRILVRAMANDIPRAWRFSKPDYAYSACRVEAHCDCSGRVYHEARYETEQGTVKEKHYGYQVAGTVSNGAGFVIAVFLVENTTHVMTAYAIGAEGDTYALSELPNITPVRFVKDE